MTIRLKQLGLAEQRTGGNSHTLVAQELRFHFDNDRHHAASFRVDDTPEQIAGYLHMLAARIERDPHLQ